MKTTKFVVTKTPISRVAKLLIWIQAVALVMLPTFANAQEFRSYYVTDVVGSPVVSTDQNVNLKWTQDYRPYGEKMDRASSASSDDHNERWFTGAQQSALTGLVSLGGRHYDPVTGRFISVDPVGVSVADGSNFNRYWYANNNPYKFIDPDGELPILIPILIFLAKEAAAELASQATGGATDFLSVRRMGTKGAKFAVRKIAERTDDAARAASRVDGPKFDALKDHAARHSTVHPNAYYNAAVRNLEAGKKFSFRHDRQFKSASITRTGPDSFTFTSASTSGDRIFTHMDNVNTQYLRNLGITLPKAF